MKAGVSGISWFTILVSLYMYCSYPVLSQTYKAREVYISMEEGYLLLDTIAYLDYNTDKKYVELIFNDSVHYYKIKKRHSKVPDPKRFAVWFKKTPDTMLWNVQHEGNYFFSFKIAADFFWFKQLSSCTREEITSFKKSLTEN